MDRPFASDPKYLIKNSTFKPKYFRPGRSAHSSIGLQNALESGITFLTHHRRTWPWPPPASSLPECWPRRRHFVLCPVVHCMLTFVGPVKLVRGDENNGVSNAYQMGKMCHDSPHARAVVRRKDINRFRISTTDLPRSTHGIGTFSSLSALA